MTRNFRAESTNRSSTTNFFGDPLILTCAGTVLFRGGHGRISCADSDSARRHHAG